MTVAERLAQPLDASRVKQREGSGGRSLSYIETHDAIRTANDIFGFGGWGHQVEELRLIGTAPVQNRDGKLGVHVGYLCVVKLFVKLVEHETHAFTSGVGYGDATEYREGFAMVTAHELAAKEAESDALKRALKNYGDQFGLALYDKDAKTAGHVTAAEPRPQFVAPASAPPAAPETLPSGFPEFRFASGKYEGKTLGETPPSYLDWYLEKGPRQDVKDAIISYTALATVGGGSGDDDIPFAPTMDGTV